MRALGGDSRTLMSEVGAFVNSLHHAQAGDSANASANAAKLAPLRGDAAALKRTAQRFMDDAMHARIGMQTLSRHFEFAVRGLDSDPEALLDEYPLAQNYSVMSVLRQTIEQAQFMATEKLGVATEVVIEGELSEAQREQLRLTCVDSHLHFVAMELLKNAMQACANKFGTLQDHPPISLRLALQPSAIVNEPAAPFALESLSSAASKDEASKPLKLVLTVGDRGIGIAREVADRVFDYSFTTAEAFAEQSGYTYSRRFGAPFTGIGVGLPVSRQYCRFMGGELSIDSAPSDGFSTTATASFDLLGQSGDLLPSRADA